MTVSLIKFFIKNSLSDQVWSISFEFLEEASQQLGPDFAKIVIIMLTTSLDPRDQQKAKEFEIVKDYVNKPLTVDGLKQVISLLHQS
jgi:response regulator RpfG family c-di-GMP phosphodiesterase